MRYSFMCILLLTLALPAQAARYALVIGNGDYPGQGKLNNPVNDAQGMKDLLEKQLGFTVIAETNVDKARFEQALQSFSELLRQSKEPATALFYFSGHGFTGKDSEDNDTNYLVPLWRDTPRNQVALENASVPANHIIKAMRRYNAAGVNLMVLDACRDSPQAFVENYAEQGKGGSGGGGFTGMQGSGVFIAYATALNRTAYGTTTEKYSLYTGKLLEVLSEPVFLNKNVTEVFNETALRVSELTQQAQEPWTSGSGIRFCFGGCGGVVAATPTPEQKPVFSEKPGFSAAEPTVAPTSPSGQKITVAGRTYIAYDNGTALDTATGLMWMRCSLGQTWDGKTCKGDAGVFLWEKAKQQTSNFAGYSDWHLPTIEELKTLVYCSNGKPEFFSMGKNSYIDVSSDKNDTDSGCTGQPGKDHDTPTIVQRVFPNTPEWASWSSSPFTGGSYDAQQVFFSYGFSGLVTNDKYGHTRLVRGGQVASGVDPQSSHSDSAGKHILHYTAYADGTAKDLETGLTWMRCSVGQEWDGKTCIGKAKTFTWKEAKIIRLEFAGYKNWRLPSIEELRTLVYCNNGIPAKFSLGKNVSDNDIGCGGKPGNDHASPAIVQEVFPNTPSDLVWSFSASALDAFDARGVFFYFGSDSYGSGSHCVRLVRGGQ